MATVGKAYEKGRREAFKECYDLFSKLMEKKEGFVTHVKDGEAIEYCPCDDLKLLRLSLLALSQEDKENGKKEKV
jgi:hypothetical protein